MINYFKSLPPDIFLLVLVIFSFSIFYLGYLLGNGLSYIRFKKDRKGLLREEEKVRRGIKKLLDEEKDILARRCEQQEMQLKHIEKQLEGYRLKLSGLGGEKFMFFRKDKKRAQLLHSLLLENEILEQLLGIETKTLFVKAPEELYSKLVSIKQRQQMFSEIFSDSKLKNYVQEALLKKTDLLEAKKVTPIAYDEARN